MGRLVAILLLAVLLLSSYAYTTQITEHTKSIILGEEETACLEIEKITSGGDEASSIIVDTSDGRKFIVAKALVGDDIIEKCTSGTKCYLKLIGSSPWGIYTNSNCETEGCKRLEKDDVEDMYKRLGQESPEPAKVCISACSSPFCFVKPYGSIFKNLYKDARCEDLCDDLKVPEILNKCGGLKGLIDSLESESSAPPADSQGSGSDTALGEMTLYSGSQCLEYAKMLFGDSKPEILESCVDVVSKFILLNPATCPNGATFNTRTFNGQTVFCEYRGEDDIRVNWDKIQEFSENACLYAYATKIPLRVFLGIMITETASGGSGLVKGTSNIFSILCTRQWNEDNRCVQWSNGMSYRTYESLGESFQDFACLMYEGYGGCLGETAKDFLDCIGKVYSGRKDCTEGDLSSPDVCWSDKVDKNYRDALVIMEKTCKQDSCEVAKNIGENVLELEKDLASTETFNPLFFCKSYGSDVGIGISPYRGDGTTAPSYSPGDIWNTEVEEEDKDCIESEYAPDWSCEDGICEGSCEIKPCTLLLQEPVEVDESNTLPVNLRDVKQAWNMSGCSASDPFAGSGIEGEVVGCVFLGEEKEVDFYESGDTLLAVRVSTLDSVTEVQCQNDETILVNSTEFPEMAGIDLSCRKAKDCGMCGSECYERDGVYYSDPECSDVCMEGKEMENPAMVYDEEKEEMRITYVVPDTGFEEKKIFSIFSLPNDINASDVHLECKLSGIDAFDQSEFILYAVKGNRLYLLSEKSVLKGGEENPVAYILSFEADGGSICRIRMEGVKEPDFPSITFSETCIKSSSGGKYCLFGNPFVFTSGEKTVKIDASSCGDSAKLITTGGDGKFRMTSVPDETDVMGGVVIADEDCSISLEGPSQADVTIEGEKVIISGLEFPGLAVENAPETLSLTEGMDFASFRSSRGKFKNVTCEMNGVEGKCVLFGGSSDFKTYHLGIDLPITSAMKVHIMGDAIPIHISDIYGRPSNPDAAYCGDSGTVYYVGKADVIKDGEKKECMKAIVFCHGTPGPEASLHQLLGPDKVAYIPGNKGNVPLHLHAEYALFCCSKGNYKPGESYEGNWVCGDEGSTVVNRIGLSDAIYIDPKFILMNGGLRSLDGEEVALVLPGEVA